MTKVTLKLSNMSCPSCMTKIQKALSQINGVEKISVLFNAGKVKAEIDESQTEPNALAKVVTSLGYPVEKIIVK